MVDIGDIKVKSTQLRGICGINKSTLDRWIWQGIFAPAEEGKGSGKHREYSFQDILICHLISDLNQSGVRLVVARDIAQEIRKNLNDALLELGWLVVDLIDPANSKIVQSEDFRLNDCASVRVLLIDLKEIALKIKLAVS